MSDHQNSLVKIILIFCLSVSLSAKVAAESFKERDFKTLPDGTKHYTEINGIYTKPDASPPYPAVIILQSCGGTKNFLFDWARKFNNRGYAALIVQSLEASGKSQCERPFNRYTVLSSVASHAYGALDYLREKPSIQKNKIAVVGFSMGAGAINDFIMNAQDSHPSGDFAGTISFYQKCPVEMGAISRIPNLQIAATKDKHHYPSCASLSNRLINKNFRFKAYEGAHHGFDDPAASGKIDIGGNQMIYSPQFAKQAEFDVLEFLDEVFKNH